MPLEHNADDSKNECHRIIGAAMVAAQLPTRSLPRCLRRNGLVRRMALRQRIHRQKKQRQVHIDFTWLRDCDWSGLETEIGGSGVCAFVSYASIKVVVAVGNYVRLLH